VLIQTLCRALDAAQDKRIFRAMLTWPTFSIASFTIVSRMDRLGIRPQTVIDVGANIGQFATAACALFAKAHVHSFEPHPAACAALRKTLKRFPNSTIYETAVGDSVGSAAFVVSNDSQSSSLMEPTEFQKAVYPKASVNGVIDVPVTTLDTVFGGRPLSRPMVLKLDVQGAEHSVLKGGPVIVAQADYILVELALKPLYKGQYGFEAMLQLLRDLGFRPLQPLDLHWSHTDSAVTEMDWLFGRNG